MLSEIEISRLAVSQATDPAHKGQLGQFFTPATIARFMADLFARKKMARCRLLDAGAGIGSLSAAFLERCGDGKFTFGQVEVEAFEIDHSLRSHLCETLSRYEGALNLTSTIRHDDFIQAAVEALSGSFLAEIKPGYTHAILNPPYRKIQSRSAHRAALRQIGIETVNLYSAFVALSLSLLENQGELVAIIPRSFCNGPYYRPFREHLLQQAAIRHMHLFTSRKKAFQDDDVLQENVIIMLVRNGQQREVTISTSTDDSFTDIETHDYPFESIVLPENPELFIHVPTSPEHGATESSNVINSTLEELALAVSTGPVVDFRLKDHLCDMPEAGSVPLLYPSHFGEWFIDWPKSESKKPNAIRFNPRTRKWLYPNGFYCVVRRFSSKEEKRRIVASVVRPDSFPGVEMLGFENHLNVFHAGKKGLPEALAYGLAVFLNTTSVDQSFRRFNGHTQVNATDLRLIKYPSRESLFALGEWALRTNELSQAAIDTQLESLSE